MRVVLFRHGPRCAPAVSRRLLRLRSDELRRITLDHLALASVDQRPTALQRSDGRKCKGVAEVWDTILRIR